ncbi:NAD(P)/FAD-dependent oxidoreductase [Mucilaginibacter terrae]|uniref:D-amino-acid dehydrogenase n=1 Tax=Mucilaginibacter terrae TaxID=1955052 RepID=A0ABU3GV84_9SPHI|nr:FAD-dependent oxidoreductase [Mucilaginibacter terrae]MDT3403692.1 D-amino-acid dehydrogenase [Mucilaginibacter terrae]
MSNQRSAIVIGGGIIGLCSAYYLVQSGWKVTIIDKGNLADNCSSGNAGMIVPSHFIPLAAPGMVAKGIRWMFNSKSPFYVKPSFDPKLISWGLQFIKHANDAQVNKVAPALRDLHLLSKQLYTELAANPELNFGFEDKGILMLYKTEKAGVEEIHVAQKAQQLGLDVEVLNHEQVQRLEPHTHLNVKGAVHYRCDAHIYPNALVKQLTAYLKAQGVDIKTNCTVNSFGTNGGQIQSIETSSGTFNADLTIMTGGAWLPELAQKAGMKIPVMPGKGYSFMVDNTANKIIHPSLLLEARVAITPMNGQVRIGGTMEIGAINSKINMNRVQGIVNAVPNYYPEHQVKLPEVNDVWYGFRPCSPDGLPYIGFSQKWSNLIVAGGHGMMGLGLGPATGKLVAELADSSSLSTDIKDYNPNRFN